MTNHYLSSTSALGVSGIRNNAVFTSNLHLFALVSWLWAYLAADGLVLVL